MVTIVLSWAFIHTIFALHYAHEFYDEDAPRGGGMAFPGGEEEPDYWDFVYFSFVIGMTAQVSDVGITSKQIRRTVTAHGIVSFLFNAALLALTVNLAAGAHIALVPTSRRAGASRGATAFTRAPRRPAFLLLRAAGLRELAIARREDLGGPA